LTPADRPLVSPSGTLSSLSTTPAVASWLSVSRTRWAPQVAERSEQARRSAIAAERELPYACVPAGTRKHFALDLGVDRDDVVGALDAFVGGGEKRVDLAEVNGRVFVDNVSLGLYADAVQRDGYREEQAPNGPEHVARGPGN
jgi:hypothetical protein